MKENHKKIQQSHVITPLPHREGLRGWVFYLSLFFLFAWLWASWWMGDVMRIAYERSFFAPDSTLMYWLWQQKFGWLWIIGRVLLTLYHWPVVGGLLVATLLTSGSWLIGYCLRLPRHWRWLQYLPAAVWMLWAANTGLNLYYKHEPGRILAIPFLVVVLGAVAALATWTFKSWKRPKCIVHSAEVHSDTSVNETLKKKNEKPESQLSLCTMHSSTMYLITILLCFALPVLITHFRHPYMRPLTRMEVQLMHNDVPHG